MRIRLNMGEKKLHDAMGINKELERQYIDDIDRAIDKSNNWGEMLKMVIQESKDKQEMYIKLMIIGEMTRRAYDDAMIKEKNVRNVRGR